MLTGMCEDGPTAGGAPPAGRRARPAALSPPVPLRRTAAGLLGWLAEAVDLVLPRNCPGCHAPVPWCPACAATLAGRPRAVALPDLALDRLSMAGLPVPAVHALTRYTGPVRAAILAGKERGRRDLPPVLGEALGRGLARLQDAAVLPDDLWLVPAPTRPSAARARGGDPVQAMARAAARTLAELGRPTGVAPCLSLARGARDSVGLDAAGRAANLAGRIRFRRGGVPTPSAAAVLLDDVLTSGATVTGSLQSLATAGFPVAGVLVLASVPPLRPLVLPVEAR